MLLPSQAGETKVVATAQAPCRPRQEAVQAGSRGRGFMQGKGREGRDPRTQGGRKCAGWQQDHEHKARATGDRSRAVWQIAAGSVNVSCGRGGHQGSTLLWSVTAVQVQVHRRSRIFQPTQCTCTHRCMAFRAAVTSYVTLGRPRPPLSRLAVTSSSVQVSS